MEIRRYREEDEVKELIRRSVESVDPEDYSEEDQEYLENVIPGLVTERQLPENRFLYFVAEKDGEIVGMAGFQRESGTIAGMFVDPEHRKEGIGSQLLEKIEEKAREEGLEKMETLASLEALEFYSKNGYEEVEKRENNIEGKDIPVMLMEKQL